MRYLTIYLYALAFLSPSASSAIRPGASQLRDLAAFPKYEVQFLNNLPLAASDADRCQTFGIEREEQFLGLRIALGERRRLSDGTEQTDIISQVSSIRSFVKLMTLGPVGPDPDELDPSRFRVYARILVPHAFGECDSCSDTVGRGGGA